MKFWIQKASAKAASAAKASGLRKHVWWWAWLLGLEAAWYMACAGRRWRIMRTIPLHLKRGYAMHHKPLAFVLLMHVYVVMFRAWLRYSTGAAVHTCVMGDGSRGNVWVWRAKNTANKAREQSIESREEGAGGEPDALIAFPGVGIGAAPYARVLRAVSERLRMPVACLEDPSSFAAHQLYTFPPLSMLGWQCLYKRAHKELTGSSSSSSVKDTVQDAVNGDATTKTDTAETPSTAGKNGTVLWAHSCGSFVGAAMCHLEAPHKAVFYEPAALRGDWSPGEDVAPAKTWWERFSTWLVVNEECSVKAMISSCRDLGAGGLVKRICLLTEPLREGVSYRITTADRDQVFNTAQTRALFSEAQSSRIQWRSHPGEHGDNVTLVNDATAKASASDLCHDILV